MDLQRFLSLFLFMALALQTPVFAQNQMQNDDGKIHIYYFYGDGCPHCAIVSPYLNELKEKYSNLEIKKFEIYNNLENRELLNKYFDAYNAPLKYRGVPAVFINGHAIIGDVPIKENLEKYIVENDLEKNSEPSLNVKNPQIEGTQHYINDLTGEVSLLVITGAALADSINPCAIAVLLILLNAMLAIGDRKKALYAGLAFIASIYISYFLFGLGIFSAVRFGQFSSWFYIIVAVLTIIIGFLNIKDYLWYRAGGFAMEIPMSWRPLLRKIIEGITNPLGAFLMGFVVCLFELPCTGGPYFFILGLLADKATQVSAIPLLLYYNVFFVLPLLIILGLVYFGFSTVEKTQEWKEKNLKLLHLVAGIVLIALGVWALMGIFI